MVDFSRSKYSDHLPVCHYLTTETGDGIFGVPRVVLGGHRFGRGRSRIPLYAERDVIPRSLGKTTQIREKSYK